MDVVAVAAAAASSPSAVAAAAAAASPLDPAVEVAVAKARIGELENTVLQLQGSLHEEKRMLREMTDKKNAQIDLMRVKVNRYEFALKEAVLFLEKPMENYEHWMAGRSEAVSLSVAQTGETIARAAAQRRTHGDDDRARRGSAGPQDHRAADRAALSEGSPETVAKTAGSPTLGPATAPTAAATAAAAAAAAPPHVRQALEIQSLECMRLALTYLKNAAEYVKRLGADSAALELPALAAGEPAAEAGRRRAAGLTPALRREGSAASLADAGSPPPPRRDGSTSTTASASVTASVAARPPVRVSLPAATQQILLKAAQALQDDDESDLASSLTRATTSVATLPPAGGGGGGAPAHLTAGSHGGGGHGSHGGGGSSSHGLAAAGPSTSGSGSGCPRCGGYVQKCQQQRSTIERLQGDINTLANQVEDERVHAERVQLSKAILEQELEELTAQLFDQANHMVIDEARAREHVELQHRQLQTQLANLSRAFDAREEELAQMRRRVLMLEGSKLRALTLATLGDTAGRLPPGRYAAIGLPRGLISYTLDPASAQLPLSAHTEQLAPTAGLGRDGDAGGTMSGAAAAAAAGAAGGKTVAPLMVADHVLWTEFQDHVRQSVAAADADITTPFLKRVLAEDIEPVLFYAYPYPGVTGPLAKLAGMPIATKRKLLEWTIRGELEFSLWCLGDHHGAVSHADQNAMLATTLSHALLSGFARARHLTRTAPRDPAAAAAHTHAAAAVEPVPRAKCWTCTVLRECEFRVRNVPHAQLIGRPFGGPEAAGAASAASAAATTPTSPTPAAGGGGGSSPSAATGGAREAAGSNGSVAADAFGAAQRTPPGEWRPLCRFCRDRLLAVQDFFAFMGQIRPGGMRLGRADRQSGTVMGLFRHMLWLRRRMCLARIGSCNLFEADPPLGVQVGGAEWEKWVQISS